MKVDKGVREIDGVQGSDVDWQTKLTPDQYRVLRCSATEAPFTGKYWNHHADGAYLCAGCGSELFLSESKFDSGSGWPSFGTPAAGSSVVTRRDNSHGMRRVEVVCGKCDGHLGHVFDDGPKPTGMRYCINSAALAFKPQVQPGAGGGNGTEVAVFAGGCFWCTEAAFEGLAGVKDVTVGYMGGTKVDPSYKEVCTGTTGHAEVARVTFDPTVITFASLLEVFWKIHDPTSLNKQGADEGSQYRSAIFWLNEQQRTTGAESIAALEKRLGAKVVTELCKAAEFYPAESYHQDYFRKNPDEAYCRRVIVPKLKKLAEKS